LKKKSILKKILKMKLFFVFVFDPKMKLSNKLKFFII
jgi:hypothetical protein